MPKKKSKWEKADGSANKEYTPSYAKQSPPRFSPKKAVRSFRDLEVYQRTMECSVIVVGEVVPILAKESFPLVERMRDAALAVPLCVARAHGLRFADFAKAMMTIEQAMQGCNTMIVYLEQANGLSTTVDPDLLEDLSSRYMQVRGKLLRLQRSWQKFHALPKR